MSKKIPIMYLCTALVTLVPIAGRLYYGIPVIILINFLMLTTTLFDYGLCILKIDSLKKTYLMMFLVGMVLFFRQILIFYSPMVALGLGFMLYIPIAEVLLLGDFFTEHKENLANTLKQNMRASLIFSLYVFMFFLLREVIGYGTVSLPTPSGMFKVVFPSFFTLSPFIFFASIPGALVLIGLFYGIMTALSQYADILHRSPELRPVKTLTKEKRKKSQEKNEPPDTDVNTGDTMLSEQDKGMRDNFASGEDN